MSSSNLLRGWEPLQVSKEVIKESRDANSGKILLKGILQRANALNQNGRIYPKNLLQREINNYQKFINESRALGECDHPNSSVVELKNVSHIVKEAHFEGDVVFGTIELLDTPSGKILQSLVESGVQLGISSRGVGSTRKEGDALVVQDDFCLICFDMVAEPSTPNAFLFTESVDRNILNKTFTASDRITRIANDIIMQGKKE
jgi:hypothetical protein